MQSKIAHAAERKAFSIAIDQVIKSASGKNREQAVEHVINMAEKLLRGTNPGAIKSMRAAMHPGSKWEQWLFRFIDETNPNVIKNVVLTGGYEAAFRGLRTCTEYADKYQCNVPWIILFDPTSACNKHCVGCWAADYGNALNLTLDDMDRLVSESKAMGTHLFMLTGGEPLVRKKDILKIAEKHNDCLFNIFTNASLVDDDFCKEVQRLGNIVFSVSVEGTEETNDSRRGEGSFNEVMAAFDKMHKYGLVYGTSTAYTRANIDVVTSDDYFQNLIDHGCRWAWFFHYMPVGEGASADLMPTIEQRKYVMQRIREVRGIEGGLPIFAMDFQNDGEYVGGCIAGGRSYCHVNARGDVEPCVFIHYSNVNFKEHSWLECLQQPIFQSYRAHYPWNDNMLQPCPMLENPDILPEMVHESGAKSTQYTAEESVETLHDRVAGYAKEWAPEANKLWLEEHPTGKKVYDFEESIMDIDKKAKMLAEQDSEAEAVLD